jgi:geranylgeranyl diphosphate synthase type I
MTRLLAYREDIDRQLRNQIGSALEHLGRINDFAPELRNRLEDYALRGKLIRGSLVPFTYDLLGADTVSREDLFKIAAAIELFQSMLLVHDDIMDQDDVRRGKPSIHAQYRSDGREGGLADPEHYGLSLGICAGDVSAFIAFGVLSRLELDPLLRSKLISFVADEMVLVGVAQMQDVHHGELPPNKVSLEAVERMYRYKTGRYTFSLAMSLGSQLAGRDDAFRKTIEDFGEALGIIFQIVDDKIGLFSPEEKTGKPAGSDLYEGKKTVYMQTLLAEISGPDRDKLEALLGNIESKEDIGWIMDQLDRHGIPDRVEARLRELSIECRGMIDEIAAREPKFAEGLRWLLDFNIERDY